MSWGPEENKFLNFAVIIGLVSSILFLLFSSFRPLLLDNLELEIN